MRTFTTSSAMSEKRLYVFVVLTSVLKTENVVVAEVVLAFLFLA
jgi:hypothetical protein